MGVYGVLDLSSFASEHDINLFYKINAVFEVTRKRYISNSGFLFV